MVKEYKIEGMTCGGCVAKVKKSLEYLSEVERAEIQLIACLLYTSDAADE